MSTHQNKPGVIALLCFLLLLGIYLLTYNGFPASDDEHLFISAAQSLAAAGELQAHQLTGNDRIQGRFSGVEALHSILAAPLANLLGKTPLGGVQGLYLLTPLYTALTAALLVVIVYRQSNHLPTAALTALAFGLTTIAWPYSQTFFREPLAMLLLTASWLAFQSTLDSRLTTRRRGLAGAAFLLLYLGVLLTKMILLAALPAFLYLFLLPANSTNGGRSSFSWRRLGTGVLALLVVFFLVWGLRAFLPAKVSARLGPNFFIRLWQQRRGLHFSEIPLAAAGMLFSPAKGLFVYNPVLWLFPLSIFFSNRRQRRTLAFALLALAGPLAAQGAAYGIRWWNTTWSTRSLLPVMPILVGAVLLPLVQIKSRWKYALWGLAAAGLLIQIGGVLIATSTYLVDLYLRQGIPDIALTIWQPRHAPLLEHWRLLTAGQPLNLAAARLLPAAPAPTAALIALGLSALLIVIALLFRTLAGREMPGRKIYRLGLPVSAILTMIVMPVLMLSLYRWDPFYYAARSDLSAARQQIIDQAQPGDVVLVYAYLNPAWYYYFNFFPPDLAWYSLPAGGPYRDDTRMEDLLDRALTAPARVWLLAETGPSESQIVLAEGYLSRRGQLLEEYSWDPAGSPWRTRLTLYGME